MKELIIIQNKLKEPFHECDLEWRIQSAGGQNKPWAKVLCYITSRAVMDRLDNVVGIENWKDEYVSAPNGGLLCRLSLKLNGEWITKEDGAENTNVEAVKGGLSSALKRTAVKFGIGRYLYNLTENWAIISNNGKNWQAEKPNKYISFKWDAPPLPEWALPKKENQDLKKQNPGVDKIQEMVKKINDGMNELKKINIEIPKEVVNDISNLAKLPLGVLINHYMTLTKLYKDNKK